MGDLHVMRDDLRPPNPPPTRHLISIGDLRARTSSAYSQPRGRSSARSIAR